MTTQEGVEKQASLPDPETAYNNLFNGVHQQVFFGRLAAHGVAPQTEKEAEDLLMLAGRLRSAEEQEKTAGDSRFGAPLAALDGVLSDEGMAKSAYDMEEAYSIKMAAAELAQDPTIYNSVLALKAAEAEAIAAQMGQQ
jgi:hypothetical protein